MLPHLPPGPPQLALRGVCVGLLCCASIAGCTDPALPSVGGGLPGGGGAGAGGESVGGAGGEGAGGLGISFEKLELEGTPDQVVDFAFVPGRDEIVVLEKLGKVSHYAFDGNAATLLGSFELPVFTETDCGLISVAFAPDFPITQHVYLGYCTTLKSSQIARFSFDLPYEEMAASEELVIANPEPAASEAWHNVGSIGFEPSGVLWALFGEKTISANGQDTSVNLGKLLRIVPKQVGPGYDPAPDNPFIGDADKSPDIYAYGLRSPWKGVRDSQGHFWIGDVGSDKFEEVNYVDAPGQNFGWNVHEGPCDKSIDDNCRDPLTYWDRTSDHPYPADDPDAYAAGTRVVCIGAHIEPIANDPYGGKLDGITFFGDFVLGWVRALRQDENGAIELDVHVGHLPHASSWKRGPDGTLYLMTYGILKATDPAAIYRVRAD